MSGDLRAAVEGLPTYHDHATSFNMVSRAEVIDLIPEGAVLVTEEALAAAIDANWVYLLRPLGGQKDGMRESAAAILRHLREGT